MKTTVHLISFLLFSVFVFLSGCGSKELARSSAQNSIETNSDFKQTFLLLLMQGNIAGGGQGKMAILENETETPAQAAERKKNQYFELYPQVAVANQLGLVEAQVKAVQSEQPKHESWMDEPAWFFNEKYLTTEKGKQLWKDYNLPPSENSIPLAKKEFIEVTGVTKEGEDSALAQFTWKWLPNETAKYFDPATDEFKSLPADIQERMLGRQPATLLNRNPENKTIKFTPDARQGQATFRRYDDGWRLDSITFR